MDWPLLFQKDPRIVRDQGLGIRLSERCGGWFFCRISTTSYRPSCKEYSCPRTSGRINDSCYTCQVKPCPVVAATSCLEPIEILDDGPEMEIDLNIPV
jgi:hypothetical protein